MGRSKEVLVAATLFLLIFTIGIPSSSAKSVKQTKEGSLDLWETDFNGNIVEGSAYGKLKFNSEGPTFNFQFNGKGLVPLIDYVLLRSLEPETNLPYFYDLMATETSDDDGNLSIEGSYNFEIDLITAKFHLVPQYMLDRPGGDPPYRYASGRYLSGQGLIRYNDTDTDLQCGCDASGINFNEVGIPVGGQAIDFRLKNIEGEDSTLYGILEDGKPLLLIFGAYT